MRTKRIKAANVRIGDVLYGIGPVTGILHLSRTEVDLYTENTPSGNIATYDLDQAVEVVTSSTNPAVVLP